MPPPTADALAHRARALVLATIAVASSLHGALVVWALGALFHVGRSDRAEMAVLAAITTPLLAMLVAAATTRSSAPLAASVGLSALGGALNVPAALLLAGVAHVGELSSVRDLVFVPIAAVVATVFASPVSVGAGIAFGIAFAPLLVPTARELRAPDHLVVARTVRRCGLWLSAVGALGVLLVLEAELDVARAAGGTMVVAGAAAALAAAWVETRRRAWIARVRRGEVAGWAVVPRAGLQLDDDLLVFDGTRAGDEVLVRVACDGDGAYRTTPLRTPWAALEGTGAA